MLTFSTSHPNHYSTTTFDSGKAVKATIIGCDEQLHTSQFKSYRAMDMVMLHRAYSIEKVEFLDSDLATDVISEDFTLAFDALSVITKQGGDPTLMFMYSVSCASLCGDVSFALSVSFLSPQTSTLLLFSLALSLCLQLVPKRIPKIFHYLSIALFLALSLSLALSVVLSFLFLVSSEYSTYYQTHLATQPTINR